MQHEKNRIQNKHEKKNFNGCLFYSAKKKICVELVTSGLMARSNPHQGLIKEGGGRDQRRRISKCVVRVEVPRVEPKKTSLAVTKNSKNGRWELFGSCKEENQVVTGAGRCGGGAGIVTTTGAKCGEEREGSSKPLLMI